MSRHLWEASKLPLDKYPNVKRWLTEGVEQLDSWKNTQGAVNKALLPNGVRTTPVSSAHSSTPSSVRTTVNYSQKLDAPTEIYFYETDKAKNIHTPGDAPVEISVHNAWPTASSFTLDTNGFSIHSFPATHSNWTSDDAVSSSFYPEVVSFLQKTTGASKVLVFDHTIRSERNATKPLTDEKQTSQRTPVMLVHCDYTAESGPLRLQQLLPSEASGLMTHRYAFINVWKPLNLVEERPLAMCDTTSCQDDDFFKLYLRYRDRVGENYVMRHSERHKWWYFPGMDEGMCVLLKTFDSKEDVSRFVGHTAFVDPGSRAGAPMRESVEVRTICFW